MAPAPFLTGLGQTSAPSAVTRPDTVDHDRLTLQQRYDLLQQYDKDKNDFIGEILMRYECLSQQYQYLASQNMQDAAGEVAWLAQKPAYEQAIQQYERALSENPFVMVLIDGDGMIFHDNYVRDGEAGGRRAASHLDTAVRNWIENEDKNVPLNSRVICRIYANVRGLGNVLVKIGAIEAAEDFEDFVRGFTQAKTMFDFIDVGAGKDRADEKIIENLKIFSQDYHCRRLLFGCSHDNGYARVLEESCDKPEIVNKVVLLEGVPFEKELLPLPYSTKKFSSIFRQSKLVVWNSSAPVPDQAHIITGKESPRHVVYDISTGLPGRLPPPVRQVMDSPVPARATTIGLLRTPSTSTIASEGFVVSKFAPPINTWAAKAAAPPPRVSTSPAYEPADRNESIARNRAGQRIDPPCKDYDKAEVDRVKKLKLCNVHFLRQECSWGMRCTHRHDYDPSRSEIATLRLVARMSPCASGSVCQDFKCMFGHRCPAPPIKVKVPKGTKPCIFMDACKFPIELHDIDANVVKTLVIR
ncbi:CCCH zinc finger dna binding protein [Stagonosporopsis vannaccii]|nr:CCCH zinc finger dna binding protein [Stagonosporopsis vannaccii]